MTAKTVQFTATDASFLMDTLHHLTRPLSVNARALAAHKGVSPSAISVRVSRIKKRYNLEISCEGTTDPHTNKTPQKGQKRITMGTLSPDSDLAEDKTSCANPFTAPPTPPDNALRTTVVNAQGSPRKRRREVNTASPRGSRKTNRSPASLKKSKQASGDDDLRFDHEDLN